jgi:hypothetical protein
MFRNKKRLTKQTDSGKSKKMKIFRKFQKYLLTKFRK